MVLVRLTKLLFFTLLFCTTLVHGQDIHFSQYPASPLNLNPALTGQFDGDFRFILNHRTQWASVTTPYKTVSGSFDMRVLGDPTRKGMLTAGLVIDNDEAGTSRLGWMEAAASLGYTFKLDHPARNFISLGMQGGFAQRKISYNDLIFDEQYDGDSYNSTLPNGEAFSGSGYSYTDFSGGLNWSHVSSGSFRSNLGVGMLHLNEPSQESFLGANASKLNRRMTVHGNIQFRLFGKTELIPMALYESQGTFSEFVFGGNLKFGLDTKNGFANSFYLGAHARRADALIFLVGMEYSSVNVGISYDVNTSGLKPASQSRGGLELSLIYIIKKVRPLSGPKKPCPTYL